MRELVDRLIDQMLATGPPAELFDDFALSISITVICELLGVPITDRPQFRARTDALVSNRLNTVEEVDAIRQESRDYMHSLIEKHRATPTDDLMTALIEARDMHDRLSEPELVALCHAILVAGHETTASQIVNFVYVLLNHPGQWQRLRVEPDLIPTAVEELLRFVPFSAGLDFPRYATEDVQVGGQLVRAGEPVMIVLSAANRDALRCDSPDTLQLGREHNGHLSFGHGIHRCLGAPLARLELQEALRGLIGRLPGLRLAGEVTWASQMLLFPRIRDMPVAW